MLMMFAWHCHTIVCPTMLVLMDALKNARSVADRVSAILNASQQFLYSTNSMWFTLVSQKELWKQSRGGVAITSDVEKM
jgi:hypothetical protein